MVVFYHEFLSESMHNKHFHFLIGSFSVFYFRRRPRRLFFSWENPPDPLNPLNEHKTISWNPGKGRVDKHSQHKKTQIKIKKELEESQSVKVDFDYSSSWQPRLSLLCHTPRCMLVPQPACYGNWSIGDWQSCWGANNMAADFRMRIFQTPFQSLSYFTVQPV